MKIKSSELVNVGDVSTEGYLRLDSIFNLFQRMAIKHTHDVGFELSDLFEAKKTWILNRIVVQVEELPRLEDTIDTYTWSRGIYRFKGFRDYEIHTGGNCIIKASSLWVFVDVEKRRPVRVPADLANRYGIITEQSVDMDIEAFQFEMLVHPDFSIKIATRMSDFDINGHVNNAVILQYIETGIMRFPSFDEHMREIRLIFMHEIPLTVNQVHVHFQQTTGGCLLEISNDAIVFVRGSVTNISAP